MADRAVGLFARRQLGMGVGGDPETATRVLAEVKQRLVTEGALH